MSAGAEPPITAVIVRHWVYLVVLAMGRRLWLLTADIQLLGRLFVRVWVCMCIRLGVFAVGSKFGWVCLDTISLTELFVTLAAPKAVWYTTQCSGRHNRRWEGSRQGHGGSALPHTVPDSDAERCSDCGVRQRQHSMTKPPTSGHLLDWQAAFKLPV